MGLYDLFLTYNSDDKTRMESQMKVRSELLPFGFELGEKLFRACEQSEEVNKVCFLGNPDSDRAKFISELANSGIEIDVYGNDWNKFVRHTNITVFEPVYEDEFWYTLRKYRVQLNLMRPHNLTSHNMRTFEAGGVGAIQLAPDTRDHQNYFKENSEIFLFNDVASCCQKIRQLMELSPGEARTIRENARARSLNAGYSYQSRSVQALSIIKSTGIIA